MHFREQWKVLTEIYSTTRSEREVKNITIMREVKNINLSLKNCWKNDES